VSLGDVLISFEIEMGVGCETFSNFELKKGEFWCILGARNSGLGLQIPICTFPGGGKCPPLPMPGGARGLMLYF